MSDKGNVKKEKFDPRFSSMETDPKFFPTSSGKVVVEKGAPVKGIYSFEGGEENKSFGEYRESVVSSLSQKDEDEEDDDDDEEEVIEDLRDHFKFDEILQPLGQDLEQKPEKIVDELENELKERFRQKIQKDKRKGGREGEEKDKFEDLPLVQEVLALDESEVAPWDVLEMEHSGDKEGKETLSTKIAVNNHDFEVVTLKDIFVIFSSFCSDKSRKKSTKKGSGVLKVTKYFSKYGEKAISKDIQSAPEDIFISEEEMKVKLGQKEKNVLENLREKKKRLTKEDMEKKMNIQLSEKEKIDTDKSVMCELKRLKRFFGIVEFDSVESALFAYDQLNGVDILDSQQYLTLSVVPPDFSFEDYIFVDQVSRENFDHEKYEPQIKGRNKVFNVGGSFDWDRSSIPRRSVLQNSENASEEELLKYINLSDDDEDSDQRDEIRRTLLGSSGEDVDIEGDDETHTSQKDDFEGLIIPVYDTEENQNIQSHLQSILDDKKKSKNESYHDRMKRQRKERRNRKKQLQKKYFEENVKSINEKGLRKIDGEEETQRLRKLIQSSDDVERDTEFNIKVDAQRENQRVQRDIVSGRETGFSISMDDDRFKSVVNSPDFTIDPTHKKFKKTENYEKIVVAKRKRLRDENPDEKETLDDSNYFKSSIDEGRKKRNKKRRISKD